VYEVFKGDIERSPFCEIYTGRSIQIKTTQDVPYHVDGEPSGHYNAFTIDVQPCSLNVLAPLANGKIR